MLQRDNKVLSGEPCKQGYGQNGYKENQQMMGVVNASSACNDVDRVNDRLMRQEDLHGYVAYKGEPPHDGYCHQLRMLALHTDGIENKSNGERPEKAHTPDIDGKNVLVKEEGTYKQHEQSGKKPNLQPYRRKLPHKPLTRVRNTETIEQDTYRTVDKSERRKRIERPVEGIGRQDGDKREIDY